MVAILTIYIIFKTALKTWNKGAGSVIHTYNVTLGNDDLVVKNDDKVAADGNYEDLDDDDEYNLDKK